MSNYNPSDIQLSVVGDVVAGTVQSSPPFRIFPHQSGDNINYTSEWLESPTILPNRGTSGGRRASYSTTGTLTAHMSRNSGIELLLGSGFSSTFETNIMKGGAVDRPLSIEKKMLGATTRYHRVSGCQVTKTTFSGSASDNCSISFELVGMNFTNGTDAIVGASYGSPVGDRPLAGEDVTVTIAGLTVDFVSYEVNIEFDRSPQFKFGTTSARGIGTTGNRKVGGTVSFFMPSTDYFASITDAGVPLVITMGEGDDGWKLTIPAAQFKVPEDSEDGSAIIITAEFMGANTVASGTNVLIEKLVTA